MRLGLGWAMTTVCRYVLDQEFFLFYPCGIYWPSFPSFSDWTGLDLDKQAVVSGGVGIV